MHCSSVTSSAELLYRLLGVKNAPMWQSSLGELTLKFILRSLRHFVNKCFIPLIPVTVLAAGCLLELRSSGEFHRPETWPALVSKEH